MTWEEWMMMLLNSGRNVSHSKPAKTLLATLTIDAIVMQSCWVSLREMHSMTLYLLTRCTCWPSGTDVTCTRWGNLVARTTGSEVNYSMVDPMWKLWARKGLETEPGLHELSWDNEEWAQSVCVSATELRSHVVKLSGCRCVPLPACLAGAGGYAEIVPPLYA